MRLIDFILSTLLHFALLAGLMLNVPTLKTIPNTTVSPETQAALLSESIVTKQPNTPTISVASPSESLTQTTTEKTVENKHQMASLHTSSAPEQPTEETLQKQAKTFSTTSNAAPTNAHTNLNSSPSNNPLTAATASTSTASPTAIQSKGTQTTTAATSDKKNDTTPVRNQPQTKQMTCTPSAKRQGLIGQVMAHVQISVSGTVQTAQIKGNNQDATMNQLAHEQAMRLKFPTMHNAVGTAVASYADVKLTFDCGSD